MGYSSGDTAKVDAIRELILRGFKKAGTESVFFSLGELSKNPLLKDVAGLERVLARMQKESGGGIAFMIRKNTAAIQAQSAEPSMYPVIHREVLRGVEVNVADLATLEKELMQITAKISGKRFTGNMIQSIEIIPREADNKADIIVNGVPLERAVKLTGKYWEAFAEVAQYKNHRVGTEKEARSIRDYFNTRHACPIYKLGHNLSEVLQIGHNTLLEGSKVKIEMRKKQTLGRRKKSLKTT